jgi:hypothetical protein
MHEYTDQTNLEACLQLIDDPVERAQLIEEAFRLLTEWKRHAGRGQRRHLQSSSK